MNTKDVKRLARRTFAYEPTLSNARSEEKPFIIWDEVQPGLCVRVRPTGVKTFKVAYQHSGRTRWYTIGKFGDIGLSMARTKAREVREQAADNRDPQGEKLQERRDETLRQLHQRYLEKAAQKENKSWRPTAALVEKHLLRKLGNRKAKDITRRDMWKIFDDLSDRRSLANRVLHAASAMFTWAFNREIIPDNPCRGITPHKTTAAERFLSNDEIRLVWPRFGDLGFYPDSILKLVLLTGQRPGEVCAMRWEHLDLKAGWWSLPGSPTSGWPGTKNKKDHEVPLTQPVLALLRDLDPQPSGHVFPAVRRGECIGIPSTQKLWSGLGIARFRPHDLRATAATGLDALGVVRDHIALVLNHTDGGVTAGYVRHDKRQHKRRALELWTAELLAILAGAGKTDHRAVVLPLPAVAG